jgi:phytoene dehydrogenase-like protein
MSVPNSDVVIIGAGLAGLCCGRRLHQCGIPFQILEASDGVGGRVRTDTVDGFKLDRGFQVYLPAYPEGKRVLDLPALDLRPFRRGALVRFGGTFHRVVDPRESFFGAARSLFNPVGTVGDKFRVGRYAARLLRLPFEKVLEADNRLTLDELRWAGGFSPKMIDRFFRPWLGGVTLDPSLATSSRFGRFVFRMFAEGGAAIPAQGMGTIPNQIANGLPAGSIRLNSSVAAVDRGEVILQNGERVRGRAIVVATEATAAARLIDGQAATVNFRGSVTLYYSAAKSPVAEPILILNGEGEGVVNSLVVLSDAAPTYAPDGRSLISASVVGVPAAADAELEREVRTQLQSWFGPPVSDWKLLRIDRIPYALPDQSGGVLDSWQRPVRLRPGLYVCGDHRDQASIDGAMTSGFRTAQAAAEDLHAKRA